MIDGHALGWALVALFVLVCFVVPLAAVLAIVAGAIYNIWVDLTRRR